jgi:hypothetical protein
VHNTEQIVRCALSLKKKKNRVCPEKSNPRGIYRDYLTLQTQLLRKYVTGTEQLLPHRYYLQQ